MDVKCAFLCFSRLSDSLTRLLMNFFYSFVLATRSDDISNRVATHMRSYTNKNVEKSFADYKIWEAARATSAAPTYFPRIKLDEYEYVDGGVGFNNPVLL